MYDLLSRAVEVEVEVAEADESVEPRWAEVSEIAKILAYLKPLDGETPIRLHIMEASA